MNIQDAVSCLMWAPRSRFKYCINPFYVHTDFPWENGILNLDSVTDLTADYELQAVLPKVVRVPHNTVLTPGANATWDAEFALMAAASGYDSSLPSLTWTANIAIGATSLRPVWGGQTLRSLPLCGTADTYADGSSNEMDLSASLTAHGFAGTMAVRSQPTSVLAATPIGGTTTATNAPEFSIGVVVGTAPDRAWYRVRSILNGDYIVERQPEGGSYRTIEVVPRSFGALPTDETYLSGSAEPRMDVDFRLIGGRMQIRIGDIGRVFSYEEMRTDASGNPITVITGATATVFKFLAFTLWSEALKWARFPKYDSTEINVGFTNVNQGDPIFDWLPGSASGWSAALDPAGTSLDGPIIFYRLALSGPAGGTYKGISYSNLTAGLRAVNLTWLRQDEILSAIPANPLPEAVQVTHTFDPASLSIVSEAKLAFNSNQQIEFPGEVIGTWGQWNVERGQVAMDIYGSRTLASTGLMGPPQLIFSGYGHTEGDLVASEGGAGFVMTCRDRSRQLFSSRWNLPWMDGWNVYFAMAFLAQLGKVSIDDMAFASLVPSVPFGPGSDLGDGAGGPASYLPVGTGGSILTRFSGSPLWSIMKKIANSIGYMLFFDVADQLQFRKFKLPTGIKRSFYESDAESAVQIGGGMEGCWEIRVGKTMDDVRSDAIVIGVNAFAPQWDPIVFKQTDTAVTDDPNAFNHLGYPFPSVWIDSQFAQEDFAGEASVEMLRFLRVPGLAVSIKTWVQPDIFPLDIITVESQRAGTSGIPLMVLDSTQQYTKDAPTSTISAFYVPQ